MGSSQLPIGSFYLFYIRCCFQFVLSLSLSLAILALYTVSVSEGLVSAPPTPPFSHVSCVCFFILSAFDTALISSVFRR